MIQKNNIFAVVAITWAAFALTACIVKKKPKDKDEGATAQECLTIRKAFDATNRLCIEPDLAFCATKMNMVKGMGACSLPASQRDCDTIGGALNRSLTWQNGKCQAVTSTAGQGKRDGDIRIAWSGKRTVQGAQTAFVDIGNATITIAKNDLHRVIVLKKATANCQMRIKSAGGKNVKVAAKGPASTCQGQILVINKKTGNYNVKEFSVTLN